MSPPQADDAEAAAGTPRRARPAAADCARLIRQGIDLFEALEPDAYAAGTPGGDGGWASPGAHARHVLDVLECLFEGLEARAVDYTERKRRPDVERCPEVGLREMRRGLERIRRLEREDDDLPLQVRSDAGQSWTRSTLARELQFVATHVVHHYALIRLTLSHQDIEAPPDFGVAASTLAHRDRRE